MSCKSAWPDRRDAQESDALRDVRVLDLSQNAPGPMASLLLADFGADVIHVAPPPHALAATGYLKSIAEDPLVTTRFSRHDAVMRNKRSVSLDLKNPADVRVCRALACAADVLIEEMRPGKTAKLGLDYPTLAAANPGLVYCSITGFGQTGPGARATGHDVNYVAASGVLDLLRDRGGRPTPPLNIAADYVGGITAAFAIVTALHARRRDGRGQHVDIGLADVAAYAALDLLSVVVGGGHPATCLRESIGGEAAFYSTYACSDGGYLAVGALEHRFATNLCDRLGRPDLLKALEDRSRWQEARDAFAAVFATRSRAEWLTLLGDDCCVSPVVEAAELLSDPRAIARALVVEHGGVRQVGVGPKLSRTPGRIHSAPAAPGADTTAVLEALNS